MASTSSVDIGSMTEEQLAQFEAQLKARIESLSATGTRTADPISAAVLEVAKEITTVAASALEEASTEKTASLETSPAVPSASEQPIQQSSPVLSKSAGKESATSEHAASKGGTRGDFAPEESSHHLHPDAYKGVG